MEFKRSHRVSESIHKEITALLIKGLKDPRIGFVTITGVEVSSDMRHARVFYSVMGDEESCKNTEKGLKSSVSYIRRELGKRLRMRYVPEIVFVIDKSLEYGNRIESLLRDIHEKEADDGSDSEDH